MLKKPNFKNFQIWTPYEEKLQISPDFPDFLSKLSQLGLTYIFSHMKLVGFQVREVGEKSGSSLYPLKSQGKFREFREKSGNFSEIKKSL